MNVTRRDAIEETLRALPVGAYVRSLRLADFAAIRLLHQRLFPVHYDDDFFESATRGLQDIVSWAIVAPQTTECSDPVAALRVYVDSEHIVGFAIVKCLLVRQLDLKTRNLLDLTKTADDNKTVLYIMTLGVSEECRRQGFAKYLLHIITQHANTVGCTTVFLHVAMFNTAALNLYKSIGFKELAVLPAFYNLTCTKSHDEQKLTNDAALLQMQVAVAVETEAMTVPPALLWFGERKAKPAPGWLTRLFSRISVSPK